MKQHLFIPCIIIPTSMSDSPVSFPLFGFSPPCLRLSASSSPNFFPVLVSQLCCPCLSPLFSASFFLVQQPLFFSLLVSMFFSTLFLTPLDALLLALILALPHLFPIFSHTSALLPASFCEPSSQVLVSVPSLHTAGITSSIVTLCWCNCVTLAVPGTWEKTTTWMRRRRILWWSIQIQPASQLYSRDGFRMP